MREECWVVGLTGKCRGGWDGESGEVGVGSESAQGPRHLLLLTSARRGRRHCRPCIQQSLLVRASIWLFEAERASPLLVKPKGRYVRSELSFKTVEDIDTFTLKHQVVQLLPSCEYSADSFSQDPYGICQKFEILGEFRPQQRILRVSALPETFTNDVLATAGSFLT